MSSDDSPSPQLEFIPELILDEGALVSIKSKIKYTMAAPSLSPSSKSTSSAVPKLKLQVKFGTMFHPGAHLLIRLSPDVVSLKSEEENASSQSSSSSSSPPELTCVIGRNNLFHETCHVVIDFTAPFWRRTTQQPQKHNNTNNIPIIGDYNHFAPKCHIETGSIGSGNVFEASSSMICMYSSSGGVISDGVVVSPKVKWNPSPPNPAIDDDNDNDGKDSELKLNNRVLFVLNNQVTSRRYPNGKERNIKDLEPKLSAMRAVLRRYHKLMENNTK